jgi:hypothetical protein
MFFAGLVPVNVKLSPLGCLSPVAFEKRPRLAQLTFHGAGSSQAGAAVALAIEPARERT